MIKIDFSFCLKAVLQSLCTFCDKQSSMLTIQQHFAKKKLFIIWRKRATKNFLAKFLFHSSREIVWISIALAKVNGKEKQEQKQTHNKANPFFMLFSLIKIYYHHQIPIHIVHFAHSSTNALVLMYGPEIEIEIWILLFRLRLHREYLHGGCNAALLCSMSTSLTLTLFAQLHQLIDTAFHLRWHHDELSSSSPSESIHIITAMNTVTTVLWQ